MDQPKLLARLDLPEGGDIWIETLHWQGWGSGLVLVCHYETAATSEPARFQITLADCREFQGRVYAHIQREADGQPTVLVNLKLGTDNHRKPLQLLSEAFALTVWYGEMQIQKI